MLYEPVQFIKGFLLDDLEFTKVKDSVSVHVPCTSKQMGVTDDFVALASLCAHEVTDTGASITLDKENGREGGACMYVYKRATHCGEWHCCLCMYLCM